MKNKVEKIDNVVVANEEKIDNVEKTEIVEVPVITIESLKNGEIVFLGNIHKITDLMELVISGNDTKPSFVNGLKSKLKNVRKWVYVASELVNDELVVFSFDTYNGIDNNDSFTNIYKNGILFISHLSYQSIKRIGIAKNWSESKLHKEYLISVGRITTAKSGEKISGTM